MRLLFGCLAVFLGAVSIALAARYGYKGADTTIDGVISAVVFGAIALCAFIFDAAAVRLWFMRHHVGAGIIGVIAAAALVVTFTNSLGAIAGRADTTQADRVRAKDDVATDRAELRRITKERAGLATFTPATDEDVKAAREAVAVAERVRAAECERRGPKCRERETEEQTKRDALATALTNKATTDKAAKLDDAAALVRARIAKAPSIQDANPLGAVLEQLIGAGAAVLTAWQQAVVAGVFELCLVGVMVIFELLGQDAGSRAKIQDKADRDDLQLDAERTTAQTAAKPPASPPGRSRSKPVPALASVKVFIGERVSPADGERVEMKALLQEYRAWCAGKGSGPMDLESFLEEVERVCRKVGIEIVNDAQRVFCLNVKIDADARLH